MGSESTSHTTQDFSLENTMILGKNLGKGRRIGSKDLFLFLENTMILGKNLRKERRIGSEDFFF